MPATTLLTPTRVAAGALFGTVLAVYLLGGGASAPRAGSLCAGAVATPEAAPTAVVRSLPAVEGVEMATPTPAETSFVASRPGARGVVRLPTVALQPAVSLVEVASSDPVDEDAGWDAVDAADAWQDAGWFE